uniref:Uncharacterized protein n=1 Tax=Pseudo-nitzschia australis TaxID=44445 RepID=A0A7S4AQX8_9STRA
MTLSTVPAVGFAIPGDGVTVSVGVVRAGVGVCGGASRVECNRRGAVGWVILDDTVDEIFGVLGDALAVDALAVLVNFLVEERVAHVIGVFWREWRSTTKHGIGAGLGGSRAIVWKATGAALDDTI